MKKVKQNDFYLSKKWLVLRKKVFGMYGCQCMKCGKDNTEMHIDHIFPRSLFPKFQLSVHNLQILCKNCNLEKSNKNNIDYRALKQKQICSAKFI